MVTKYRLGLRLVSELVIYGVIFKQEEGLHLLSSMLNDVLTADKVVYSSHLCT